jgi:hypothetical protein
LEFLTDALALIIVRSRRSRAIALVLLLTLVMGSTAGAGGRGSEAVSASAIPPHSAPAASSVVLYDGALGGTPDTQGVLAYQDFPPGAATQTFANGVTTLISAQNVSAGYPAGLTTRIVLDRAVGYTLRFTAQVVSESHANNNRAGFSVIVLSSDKKGIELGFWSDQVWAQADAITPPGSGMFTHAESATFDTTAGLVAYQLNVSGDTYNLSSNGNPILSGSVRDYTAFTGPVDPYETPNFVFFGDDTTSAQATLKFSYAAVALAGGPNKLYLPLVEQP